MATPKEHGKDTDTPPTIAPAQSGHPPKPPQVARTVRMYRHQLLGVPLVALPAVLALLGVFGTNDEVSRVAGTGLDVVVQHAARLRYGTSHAMEVRVTNRSAATIGRITVAIDTAYLDRFSSVAITPSADRAYAVELAEVGPGETRLVRVEMEAERYWLHAGTVRIAAGGPDTLTLGLSTFVWP